MNISKVYYEELKSKCVGGKWESVRIGAEVESDDISTPENCLYIAKGFVKNSLIEECGYDVEKNKEAERLVEKIRKEVREILAGINVGKSNNIKIKIDIRDKVGILIDTFAVERDLEEYIETTRKIFGKEWAEFLERLRKEGLLK